MKRSSFSFVKKVDGRCREPRNLLARYGSVCRHVPHPRVGNAGGRVPYVSSRIRTRILVPCPGALSTRRVPPRRVARSRIDFKPR